MASPGHMGGAREWAPPGYGGGEGVRMSGRGGDGADTAAPRREQMLRAAIEVIEERGFPETRIADVAARAGTSPALVIYYFKTKDQLLTEARRYAEDAWYEAGTRRMGGPASGAPRPGGDGAPDV